MFKASLKLKVATVMTDNRFKFLVHPLGTSYTDDANQNIRERVARPRQIVWGSSAEFWLHASLEIFEDTVPNLMDRQADALVQTKNFFRGNDSTSQNKNKCIHTKVITIEKTDEATRPAAADGSQKRVHLPLVGGPQLLNGWAFERHDTIAHPAEAMELDDQGRRAASAGQPPSVHEASAVRCTVLPQTKYPSSKAQSRLAYPITLNGYVSNIMSLDNLDEVGNEEGTKEVPTASTISQQRQGTVRAPRNHDFICRMCDTPLASVKSVKRHEEKSKSP